MIKDYRPFLEKLYTIQERFFVKTRSGSELFFQEEKFPENKLRKGKFGVQMMVSVYNLYVKFCVIYIPGFGLKHF